MPWRAESTSLMALALVLVLGLVALGVAAGEDRRDVPVSVTPVSDIAASSPSVHSSTYC